MQYRKLGRTGLKVSEICVGTLNFGEQIEEKEAIDIIETALAAGVNFFDTSNVYAEGRSEKIVGKALKGKRHSALLATKVGLRTGLSVNDAGLSRWHIMKATEDSLRRLETDYVDLYYVHLPDYETPIEETLRALDDLVHQGKVRYIGCSNFQAWQLCKALWVSELCNLTRFDSIQSPYNLITRDIEYELLALCKSEGVGVCVYNPLAAGLLTGKYDPNKPPAEGTRFALPYMTPLDKSMGLLHRERYWSASNFEAVTRLQQIAQEHGTKLVKFSLAWILNNKIITSVVCGVSSVRQLEENLGATELKISDEELKACDVVWQRLNPHRFLYGR